MTRQERPFESATAVVGTASGATARAGATVAIQPPDVPVEEHTDSGSFVESLPSITDFIVDTASGSEAEQQADEAEAIQVAEGEGMPAPVQEVPIQDLPVLKAEDQFSDSGWVNDERNAFDWQAMAALAIKHEEEHRATDEWASTNWESSPSDADHVAAMLIQVARRVKSGELLVAATRGMSTEATMAATLMALLQIEV